MIVVKEDPCNELQIVKDTCRSATKLGLFPEFRHFLDDEEMFDDQLCTFESFLDLKNCNVHLIHAYDTDSKEQAFSVVRYPTYDVHVPGPGLVMMFTISGSTNPRLIASIFKEVKEACRLLDLHWYMDSRKVGEYKYENRYHVLNTDAFRLNK